MAYNNFPSIPEMILKTDILSTDVSFKLRSILWYTGSDSVAVNLSSAAFGSSNVGYGVFEPRTSRQEFFTWDTSTIANATTTGVTILTRGLNWSSDYVTSDTSRKFNHTSGSKVVLFTDAPAMWNTIANKQNDETVTGKWTFPNNASYPEIGTSYVAPTSDRQIATKKYADDLAIAGSPNASTTVKGVVEIATGAELAAGTGTGGTGAVIVPAGSSFKNTSAGAGDADKVPVLNASGVLDQTFLGGARTWSGVQSLTADNCQITSDADSSNDAVRQSYLLAQIPLGTVSGTSGEAITKGQSLYLKASDSKLYKSVGTGDESTFSFVGIALSTVAAADLAVTYAPPGHTVTGLAGLTAGSYYFVTDTAGTLGTTPGTRFARVGLAVSTTVLLVVTPKYRRTGSQSITSATTFVQTTGFYPGKISIRAAPSSTGVGGGSIGDDGNSCIAFRMFSVANDATARASDAWYCYDANGSQVENAGTVSAKSTTGFTLNCTTYLTTATVQWEAESL